MICPFSGIWIHRARYPGKANHKQSPIYINAWYINMQQNIIIMYHVYIPLYTISHPPIIIILYTIIYHNIPQSSPLSGGYSWVYHTASGALPNHCHGYYGPRTLRKTQPYGRQKKAARETHRENIMESHGMLEKCQQKTNVFFFQELYTLW